MWLGNLRNRLLCAANAKRAAESGEGDGHLYGPVRIRVESVLISERTCQRCGYRQVLRHTDDDPPTLNTRGPQP